MNTKLNNKNSLSGIQVTLDELIALRSQVMHQSLNVKKSSSELFSGQHIAKIRGKGIEFDTTREYQPGDDIRRMAWRVTARSLKPHIKVYHEERERPVWLALDLSPSLYFGTRCSFKSVTNIKQAAYLGWSYLHKRERIGAVIANPNKTLIYKPQIREREFLTILKSLAEYSALQSSFTEENCLHNLLLTLQQQIRFGNLLFILSDFFHFDERNKKLILHLSQRAQVKLIFVYDPLEAVPPPAYRYVVTDGQRTALFNMNNKNARQHYQKQFQGKVNELIDFTRKHSISLQMICTDQAQEVIGQQ